jgi:hypothetical protein
MCLFVMFIVNLAYIVCMGSFRKAALFTDIHFGLKIVLKGEDFCGSWKTPSCFPYVLSGAA